MPHSDLRMCFSFVPVFRLLSFDKHHQNSFPGRKEGAIYWCLIHRLSILGGKTQVSLHIHSDPRCFDELRFSSKNCLRFCQENSLYVEISKLSFKVGVFCLSCLWNHTIDEDMHVCKFYAKVGDLRGYLTKIWRKQLEPYTGKKWNKKELIKTRERKVDAKRLVEESLRFDLPAYVVIKEVL